MKQQQFIHVTDSEGEERVFLLNRHFMFEGKDYLILQMVLEGSQLAEEAIVMYAEPDGTTLMLEPVEDEALLSRIEAMLYNA